MRDEGEKTERRDFGRLKTTEGARLICGAVPLVRAERLYRSPSLQISRKKKEGGNRNKQVEKIPNYAQERGVCARLGGGGGGGGGCGWGRLPETDSIEQHGLVRMRAGEWGSERIGGGGGKCAVYSQNKEGSPCFSR